mgnify:CR=1 FL=1
MLHITQTTCTVYSTRHTHDVMGLMASTYPSKEFLISATGGGAPRVTCGDTTVID